MEAQQVMWTKFNDTMLNHGFLKPNFKGFMANRAQANWNAMRIVYESKDPLVKMINKECICLFHWIQSFDKHIKQLIKPEFLDQHIFLKGLKSLGEANNLYVLICCWWMSLGVASKAGVHELDNWLNLWHFRVKQWGRFMVHVNISSFSFF
jgi:hypothetical protein